jgi:kinesin family member 2/24
MVNRIDYLNSNPIRNMDKRTARREYKDDFCYAIDNFRRSLALCQAGGLASGKDREGDVWKNGTIRVCVRKRPIFKDEIEKSEFDIVTCIGDDMIVIHDARMATDMKKQYINHHEFAFDRVFDENTSNQYVYSQTAAPLVDIALSGGDATCLMYGQTGSGKTFTMSYIYQSAAQEIFTRIGRFTSAKSKSKSKGGPKSPRGGDVDEQDADTEEEEEEEGDGSVVSVSFIEITGEKCADLLHCFSPVELLKGQDEDAFQAFPVIEPVVSSAQDLRDIITYGCNVRSTAATGVHDSSSRSHAVLKIYVRRQGGGKEGSDLEGSLTLVDLAGKDVVYMLTGMWMTWISCVGAGSEHRIDSMHHSATRRKEGALINKSLLALKDCIRSRAEGRDLDHFYRKVIPVYTTSSALPCIVSVRDAWPTNCFYQCCV